LKDQGFSTFLDQNPPFELRRKLAFRFQSFHEIHRGSSSTGPTLQFPAAVGGRVGWRLPSEGKGHTFESCRVRHFFFIF
jgi:hypothetical protein